MLIAGVFVSFGVIAIERISDENNTESNQQVIKVDEDVFEEDKTEETEIKEQEQSEETEDSEKKEEQDINEKDSDKKESSSDSKEKELSDEDRSRIRTAYASGYSANYSVKSK